jgi:hypothetical protein
MPPELQHYEAPEVALSAFEDHAHALETVDAVLVGSSASFDASASDILNEKFRSVASYKSFSVYTRSVPR